MTIFQNIILFTDTDGFAKFREEEIALLDGSSKTQLSAIFPFDGFQLRHSPSVLLPTFFPLATASFTGIKA